MKHTYDDEADVRTTALIRVMALFFVGIMIIAATTSPIATGTKEGERAPALEGKFYNGSGWSDFNLESYWDSGWAEGDISGQSWIPTVLTVYNLLKIWALTPMTSVEITRNGMELLSTSLQARLNSILVATIQAGMKWLLSATKLQTLEKNAQARIVVHDLVLPIISRMSMILTKTT